MDSEHYKSRALLSVAFVVVGLMQVIDFIREDRSYYALIVPFLLFAGAMHCAIINYIQFMVHYQQEKTTQQKLEHSS